MVAGLAMFFAVPMWAYQRKVDAGQDREDGRLHETRQHSEKHNREVQWDEAQRRAGQGAGQPCKHDQNNVLAEDVAEKTDREGEGLDHLRYDLDRTDKPEQLGELTSKRRPHKVADVASEAVVADRPVLDIDED